MTSDSERPEPPDGAKLDADVDSVDEAADAASAEALPSNEDDGIDAGQASPHDGETPADETTLLPAVADVPPVKGPDATPARGGWREWLRVRVTNPPPQDLSADPSSSDGPQPSASLEARTGADPVRAPELSADHDLHPVETVSEHPDATDTSIFPALDPVLEEREATVTRARSRLRRSVRFWEVQPEGVVEPVSHEGPDWAWSPEEAVPGERVGSPQHLPVRPERAAGVRVRFGSLAELRAERRELRRQISERQFDLGGLHVEMARQARIDHPLLEARALELVGANDRLAIVERAIEARRRGDDPAWASLRPCSACGAPRPQDASFCPYCGTPVAASHARRTA